jgi:hypothetical protein
VTRMMVRRAVWVGVIVGGGAAGFAEAVRTV